MALAKAADEPYRPLGWRKAQEAFSASIEGNENDVRTLDSFVNVTQLLGEGPQLEREFRERLKQRPDDFRSLYSLGALLSQEGQYAESVKYFAQSEIGFDRRTPGAETFFFNYALALSKAGQLDMAIEKYQWALRIDPDFLEARYNLSLICIAKQDYDTAIEHLTEVLNQQPAHARANITLARIYASQGKWEPARKRLQEVLQAEPQNLQAAALLQQLPAK